MRSPLFRQGDELELRRRPSRVEATETTTAPAGPVDSSRTGGTALKDERGRSDQPRRTMNSTSTASFRKGRTLPAWSSARR